MNSKLERVLEWYDRESERHLGEIPLENVTDDMMLKLFGKRDSDPRYINPYRITDQHLTLLSSFVDHSLDLDKFDYFITAYRAE